VNNIWLMIFGVLIAGTIIKMMIVNQFLAVIIDLGVLGVAYLILRRYPFVDLTRSLTFLGAMTGVTIMVDLGIIDGFIGEVTLLCLIVALFFASGRKIGKSANRSRPWHK
jgi:hypothetical protein